MLALGGGYQREYFQERVILAEIGTCCSKHKVKIIVSIKRYIIESVIKPFVITVAIGWRLFHGSMYDGSVRWGESTTT